jgi:hypothetical protein
MPLILAAHAFCLLSLANRESLAGFVPVHLYSSFVVKRVKALSILKNKKYVSLPSSLLSSSRRGGL